MFLWNQSSGKSGVGFYAIAYSPYASVELQSVPRASVKMLGLWGLTDALP
jgi:hypothetical protein